MVLFEYLQFDPPGFLLLLKEWSPSLYNTSAVINAVLDQLNQPTNQLTNETMLILLESLAVLYSYEHKYENALSMYLRCVCKLSSIFLKNQRKSISSCRQIATQRRLRFNQKAQFVRCDPEGNCSANQAGQRTSDKYAIGKEQNVIGGCRSSAVKERGARRVSVRGKFN